MYHVDGVRESIHWIDPCNSLSHNLMEYQERNKKIFKMQMLQSYKRLAH